LNHSDIPAEDRLAAGLGDHAELALEFLLGPQGVRHRPSRVRDDERVLRIACSCPALRCCKRLVRLAM